MKANLKLINTVKDPSTDVWKLIFEGDGIVVETVAYRYNDRGVICFSTMCGCPVGCTFCGTGKRFIRSLSMLEMITQIEEAFTCIGPVAKLQLMPMSMGEPMLNKAVLEVAKIYLQGGMYFFLSTVGVKADNYIKEIFYLGTKYPKFGLQFSLHSPYEDQRKALLGNFKDLASIEEIKAIADAFTKTSKNNTYFNYICKGTETEADAEAVAAIVRSHHLTCSVLCHTGGFIKADPTPALRFGEMCSTYGVKDWSVFNPAGQDTIGGGCGQLLYVQEFLKNIQNS